MRLLLLPIRTDVLNYLKFHRTDGNDSMKAQLCNRLPLLPPNYSNNVLEWAVVVVNHTPSNADDNTDHNWTYSSDNAFHSVVVVADAVAVAEVNDANDGDGDSLVTDWPNNRHDCMNLMLVADLALSLDHHWLALLLLELILCHRRRHLVPMTMMPKRMPSIVGSAVDYHLNRLQPLRADYDDDFGYALVMKHYFRIEHRTHYKNCSCCCYCCCYCCCCWRYWRCCWWDHRRQCHYHYYWCYSYFRYVAQTTEEPMQPHSVFLRVPLFSTAPHTKLRRSRRFYCVVSRTDQTSKKTRSDKSVPKHAESKHKIRAHALTALTLSMRFLFLSIQKQK